MLDLMGAANKKISFEAKTDKELINLELINISVFSSIDKDFCITQPPFKLL